MNLVEVPLGDVADLVRGITFPTSAKERVAGKGLIPCLRTTNVQGAVEWDDLIYVPDGHVRSEAQRIRQGDILVSMSNSLELVGKCALVTSVPVPATFGAFIAVVRAKDGIDPEYVFHAMRSPKFKAHIRSVASTTTNISNINSTKLLASTVVLAGDKTRKSIVSKIDELLSRIDEGARALQRVSTLVARYRQSVLKAAVTGELTRDWREAQGRASVAGDTTPGATDARKATGQPIESGETLLARILTTRREAWEQSELAKIRAKGITPKDDAWKKKYKQPTPPDTADLQELPEGWVWASLPQLGEFGRGKSKHRPRNDPKLYGGDYPFLQTGRVRSSRGRITEFDTTYNEAGLAQSKLWPKGTICITIAANIAESGILEFDACFPDSVVGLVANNLLIPEYIEFFIRTERSSLDQYAPATAQKNINLEILEQVAVPLPPIEEQRVIYSKAQEELSKIHDVGRTLAYGAIQSTALRQSVLRAAFAGGLVQHSPDDEPASALLERIAAERAKTDSAAPKRGRKRKTK